MANTNLTPEEKKELQTYLDEMDKLAAKEPQYTIGDNKSADDWEAWNKKCSDLNAKYRDTIARALSAWFSDGNFIDTADGAADIVRAILAGDNTEVQKQLLNISRYGLMNDKATRGILKDAPQKREIDGQISLMFAENQAPKGRPPVPVYIALTYRGPDAEINREITGNDDAILITIANMISVQKNGGISGPWDFTVDQIWREMNGIKDSRKTPTKRQAAKISASIDKMRFTNLLMDMTSEYNAHYIKLDDDRVKNGIADENYIYAAKRHIKTVKGRDVDVYRFFDVPFMYVYNLAKGHVVYVNYDLLDTSDETGNEGYTSVFRLYLLREITLMYQEKRNNHRILYSTLYKDTGTPTPEQRASATPHKTENAYITTVRKEAKKDREKIAGLLRSWTKEKKDKWILDFKDVKEGRKFTGVEIELNPAHYEKDTPKELPGEK